MTGMRLHDDLSCGCTWTAFGMNDCGRHFESLFRIGDKFGFDHRTIFFIAWKFVKDVLWQTKSPIAVIIFKDPGNRMWSFFVVVQMWLQFFEGKCFING